MSDSGSGNDFLGLEIGGKLQRLREDRGFDLAQLANQSGLDEGRLRAFESNEAIPAVGDLIKLASCLDVSVGHFFATSIPDQRVELVRAGERWTVPPHSEAGKEIGYRYHALSHGLTEKLMAPFLVEVPAGQTGELPRSAHEGEEFLFVLSGVLQVQVGDGSHRLEPGDSLYYDSRLPHSLHALEGTSPRLLVCVAQPSRRRAENPIDRAYR